jgi:hypothetical protein
MNRKIKEEVVQTKLSSIITNNISAKTSISTIRLIALITIVTFIHKLISWTPTTSTNSETLTSDKYLIICQCSRILETFRISVTIVRVRGHKTLVKTTNFWICSISNTRNILIIICHRILSAVSTKNLTMISMMKSIRYSSSWMLREKKETMFWISYRQCVKQYLKLKMINPYHHKSYIHHKVLRLEAHKNKTLNHKFNSLDHLWLVLH